jgi:integrase
MAPLTAERLRAGSTWTDHDLVFSTRRGGPIERTEDWRSWKAILRQAKVRDARVHDARHTAATLSKMSRVASDASFSGSSESVLPAVQRVALQRAQSDDGPRMVRELGCQQLVASGATMMHLVLLPG